MGASLIHKDNHSIRFKSRWCWDINFDADVKVALGDTFGLFMCFENYNSIIFKVESKLRRREGYI